MHCSPRAHHHRACILKYAIVFVLFIIWTINFLKLCLLFNKVMMIIVPRAEIWSHSRDIIFNGTESTMTTSDQNSTTVQTITETPFNKEDDEYFEHGDENFLGLFLIVYTLILIIWILSACFALCSVCAEWPLPIITLAVIQTLLVICKLLNGLNTKFDALQWIVIVADLGLALGLFYYSYLLKHHLTGRERSGSIIVDSV